LGIETDSAKLAAGSPPSDEIAGLHRSSPHWVNLHEPNEPMASTV